MNRAEIIEVNGNGARNGARNGNGAPRADKPTAPAGIGGESAFKTAAKRGLNAFQAILKAWETCAENGAEYDDAATWLAEVGYSESYAAAVVRQLKEAMGDGGTIARRKRGQKIHPKAKAMLVAFKSEYGDEAIDVARSLLKLLKA